MARIRHHQTRLVHRFGPRATVGRRPGADLRIDERTCSLRHAEIRWTGEKWLIRDLGSRNGTWVDGRPLSDGQQEVLRVGMRVAFGNPPDVWEVEDLSPAVACATPPGGRTRFALDGVLELPDEGRCEVRISLDSAGRWWIETAEERRACALEEDVFIDGVPWRVLAPSQSAVTTEFNLERVLKGASVTFRVSSDEEQVTLDVLSRGVMTRISPRSHSYLLAVLARRRLADRAAGVRVQDEGWMSVADELTRAMRANSVGDINVQVHRARNQLREHGFGDAEVLFDRRPGWIRLGLPDIEVVLEESTADPDA